MKLPAIKSPAALSMCDGEGEGLSLPPPGGNGLDGYDTIRSHETDASVVSAAIKCQAAVAGTGGQLARTSRNEAAN
jgi:hypothetical protein